MLQTAFGASCMNQASVFEWHKRFKEGRESVKEDERCGRSKEVRTPELIGQSARVRVRVTMLRFYGGSGRYSVGRGQHSSNRVSGISTRTKHQSTTPSLSQTCHRPRWASRQFLTLPIVQTLPTVTFGYSLSSEAVVMRIEEMKGAVTKVIDKPTQEDIHGAFQNLLERYNKYIAAGRDYFEGD